LDSDHPTAVAVGGAAGEHEDPTICGEHEDVGPGELVGLQRLVGIPLRTDAVLARDLLDRSPSTRRFVKSATARRHPESTITQRV
jgi:hypothetical protein